MKSKNINLSNNSPYLIGIGASAGGLEAINAFFENLPSNTGFSYVVVQHLSPDHKSMMADLLSRHTEMKVVEAQDGVLIQPNCVYLLPSKKFMTVKHSKLQLHDKPPSNLPNNAIDVFFQSMAEDFNSNAVAVILSGTGFDGSKGAEKVKENGGVVIVQEPSTAAFDGMPNSAIAKGVADLILPAENIPQELIDYLEEIPSLKAFHLNAHRDEGTLKEILMLVRKASGLDFSYYKRPTLFRRITKRLLELNLTKLQDYLEYITYRPSELQAISNEFLINVTQFFRDPDAFHIISKQVLPQIFKDKKAGDTVKIWSVACCSGEETYSLAILFHEYMHKNNLLDINLKIFGTDIDKNSLDIASRGIYNKNILQHISGQRIAKYFGMEGESYRISPVIRKMIVFSYHNIIKDPPFSRMDFISCRNMLIYIQPECQKEVQRKLHFGLNLKGFLFLGSSEHIGILKPTMEEMDKKWRIYKCISKARIQDESIFAPLHKLPSLNNGGRPKPKNPLQHLPELFKETLLEEHAFTGVLIDQNFEVKQAIGNFKNYIDFPDSGLNFNLLKIVSPDLGIAISVAVRKAIKDNDTTVMRGVTVRNEKGEKRFVNITVKPYLRQSTFDQPFLFIVLNDGEKKEGAFGSKDIARSALEYDRMHELERELKENRENLQTVIEELESTNEELQSSNEEMVSTNEELQSTNEELQSLNEELHTVSAEHQLKIKELVDLNDDMNNYFNTSAVGQILIDKHLIVRKFSPAITKLVNLIDSDVNRSITDITTRFQGFDFIKEIETVIKTNIPVEKEIALSSFWYIMRIQPYTKSDKSTDGVVVSFIDITEPKRLGGILEAVFNSTPSCIVAYEALRNERNEIMDFKCIMANTAAEQEMEAPTGTLAGKRLKVSYPEKSLEHYNFYKEVVETGKLNHYEYFSEKKNKWYDAVLVKMQDGLVVIETNISDKKKAADVIAQSYAHLKQTSGELISTNLKLEQSNLDLLQFASIASHDLKEPLRKIQTYGNLLMSKVKNKMEDSELNNLNKIINASERMQKLIEDVLALSKLSNSTIPLEKVDVNAVILRIIDDLEISIKEQNAVINVSPLPVIFGIEGQIQQLFQNFICNSLKFTEDKPPVITITDKKLSPEQIKLLGINPADYFIICVKDNGIGFEDAYKDKIFGIFQRLNGNNYIGTGIGLAICKKIMENHKGFILTESVLGDGAEFILGFPKKYVGSLN